jgi:double-strand break repair protein MRE11
MIPDWMDIVIWGNEHECIPSFVESLVGTFRIYQPGSSVATSLSQGESNDNPKHMGLIEIRSDFKFRLEAIPFKNIRPFLYSDISLSSVGELDMHDSKIEEKITDILSNRVKKMIREARSLLVSNGERDISKSNTNSPAQMYQLTDPMKVIIRLKVENSGYPTISLHRFGSQFIQEVANPSEMLLFYKQKRMNAFAHDGKQNRNDDPENIEDYEDGDAILSDSSKRIRIEDLVKQHLASGAGGSKQLNLMNAEDLSLALEEFVLKKVPTAITDVVEKRLEETQLALNQDKNIHLNDLHQHVSEINSSHTTSSSTSRAIAPAVTTTVPGRASKKKKVAVSDDEDDMAVSLPKPKASKKTSVAPAASSTKRQTRGKVTKYVEEIEDDEEENDESVASSDDNMEVDGDDNDESEAISNTSASEDEQKGSKRGKSKGSVAPSKTARGKAAPPAAKSSAKAVKKTTTASTVASKFDPTTFISSNNKVFITIYNKKYSKFINMLWII